MPTRLLTNKVALDHSAVDIFQRQAIATLPAVVVEQVVAHGVVVAIHQIDADRVVAQHVVLGHVVFVDHEMQAVAAALDDVAAHDAVG